MSSCQTCERISQLAQRAEPAPRDRRYKETHKGKEELSNSGIICLGGTRGHGPLGYSHQGRAPAFREYGSSHSGIH